MREFLLCVGRGCVVSVSINGGMSISINNIVKTSTHNLIMDLCPIDERYIARSTSQCPELSNIMSCNIINIISLNPTQTKKFYDNLSKKLIILYPRLKKFPKI